MRRGGGGGGRARRSVHGGLAAGRPGTSLWLLSGPLPCGRLLSACLLSACLLAGCSNGSRTGPGALASGTAGTAAPGAGGVVTVLAAASLRATFTELAAVFEAAHPGAQVRLSFGGSSDLVAQLQNGAPGDVLATADTASMDRAAADDLLAGRPEPFATNTMMIAVPPGNPHGITTFADLTTPGLAVVVCAPQVPCGAATEVVGASTGVSLSPVSEEGSVTDVLGKVASGQADAGVVYTTEIAAAGDAVEGIAIPAGVNATNTYPIAVLAGSREPGVAEEFRDLVLGTRGAQVLAEAGFGAP